jgi:hypothetical protein
MKIKITKVESVTRQLDQAIELFFFDKDIISCLTLIWACRTILLDLAEHAWTHNWMQSLIIPEKIGEFERAMRKEQNFFKHAEKDWFANTEFETLKADWLLIDAINIYEQLPNCKLTKNMLKFQMYFIVNNPKLVNEERREVLMTYLWEIGIPDKMFIWEAFEHVSSLGMV